MLQFIKRRHKKEEDSMFFLKHGGKLLEGLASASNCRYDIPYRNFTAKEIISAMNNFRVLVMNDGTGTLFRGSFRHRPILVKRYSSYLLGKELPSYINHDMVISLMMCHHKNVLKFLGCCLDFYAPVLVYESTGKGELKLLHDILHNGKGHPSKKDSRSLSWKNRLKVATDVGNALVYLHTAFATPIIHRDFNIRNIIIDQSGIAKLLDFSLCISLPPGESQVAKDGVIGTTGYSDPEYATTGIVTEKSDVYMFGMLLLKLLSGKECYDPYRADVPLLVDYVKDNVDKNGLNKALDSSILEEKGDGIEQQLQAFVKLALRCTQRKGEDRPNMVDAARELSHIERSSCST